MYLKIEFELTENQIKQIEEQAKLQIDQALLEGKLEGLVKDTIKGVIRSVVNEEIQTKNYRRLISEKVENILLEENK